MTDRPSRQALSHVHIVLVRPSEPRNIGATCRAMKAAGITRLTIVSRGPVDREAARPVAVGAADLLDAAVVVETLEEAIAGSALVAGMTRRTGQKRKAVSFPPWELAARVRDMREGTAALLFGNEQSGLSVEELARCHMAVSIPTSPAFPSLNLSHAVQIISYELYRAAEEGAGRRVFTPIPADALRGHVDDIVASLERLGFRTQDGPRGMGTFLTDILARASVSRSEMKRLKALFQKLEGMHR